MKSKILVILGTARDESNTLKALRGHFSEGDYSLVALHQFKIEHYRYDEQARIQDDFMNVVQQMLAVDRIVFATPVYWYSMSGVMKVFFDRMTELVTTSKPLGRALAGKEMALFSVGTDPELPEGFEVPFQKTAEYFEMKYVGSTYHQT